MSLLDKLKKNSTIKESSVLHESKFFNEKDMVQTPIPAINLAFSGSFDGGLVPGLTQWAGPSRHFKTLFSLISAKAYLDKYDDAVLLFYDAEFGTPTSYFESVGIDKERVFHTPLTDIEQMKFDVMAQLNDIKRGEHVVIVIDSIGNMASKKEVEDSLDGKSVADMTRAKQLKSFFRMVTPHLNIKDIPMIVVNHVYKTLEMYSTDVVGGGTGSVYSSDNIFIIGRQQVKGSDKKTLLGYDFIINVEKSRYTKEKSKIPITVNFDGGVSKWSGILDLALEGDFVVKPTLQLYALVDPKTGEIGKGVKAKATQSEEFLGKVLSNPKFREFVKNKYSVSHGSLMVEDSIDDVMDALDEDDE